MSKDEVSSYDFYYTNQQEAKVAFTSSSAWCRLTRQEYFDVSSVSTKVKWVKIAGSGTNWYMDREAETLAERNYEQWLAHEVLK